MSPSDEQIVHVSDTALMVAACRAMETALPDGLIHDPFAERLAGERGMAIARALPAVQVLCFGVGFRSRFLDELLLQALGTFGIRTVLSIGCGLDTRPWRLELPAGLRWIEADFPAMLDYKAVAMASETPHCRLERIPADVNDAAQRRALLTAAGSDALMITEGLLTYLPAESVEAIAGESHSSGAVRCWLLDLNSAELSRRLERDSLRAIDSVRSKQAITGNEILELVGRHGWTVAGHRSYTRDAIKLANPRIAAAMQQRRQNPDLPPPPENDVSGVYLLS